MFYYITTIRLALELQEQGLRVNGPSGLVVKALTWIVSNVGSNPTWLHSFSVSFRC